MGAEAPCTLHFGGSSAEGKALLETEEILFRPSGRGGARLAIPLKEIREATADGGVLRLGWGDQRADFKIGPAAAKWLEKIKNPKGRLDKLGVKPGQRVRLVGPVEDGFAAELVAKGAEVAANGNQPVDLIFYAAPRREALAKLTALQKNLKKNGAIWVIRPKGAKEITEADVLAAGRAQGLVDVKVVAFSASHTAEKLVIPVDRR